VIRFSRDVPLAPSSRFSRLERLIRHMAVRRPRCKALSTAADVARGGGIRSRAELPTIQMSWSGLSRPSSPRPPPELRPSIDPRDTRNACECRQARG
jgi:hypothetical protein